MARCDTYNAKASWHRVCGMAAPRHTCMAPGCVLHQQYTHTPTARAFVLWVMSGFLLSCDWHGLIVING